jgi:hypothetical protein
MRADAFRGRRDVEGAGHAATARMIAMLSTASSSTMNELSILSKALAAQVLGDEYLAPKSYMAIRYRRGGNVGCDW